MIGLEPSPYVTAMSRLTRMPCYYIPHGVGPCFFMDWTLGPRDTWHGLHRWLEGMRGQLRSQPKAIVVISAHWEEAVFKVDGHHRSGLFYDYLGFPEHTYRLEYPAVGSESVAQRVEALVRASGLSILRDDQRGLDHGVFVPLLIAFPKADIPVVQLSLHNGLDPQEHLALGRALAPLRDEGVLILGSGMSFHNAAAQLDAAATARDACAFDDWLVATVNDRPGNRDSLLGTWASAPSAREAHPREEHLLPLMVVAGAAAQDRGERVFAEKVMGTPVSAFCFGGFRDDEWKEVHAVLCLTSWN